MQPDASAVERFPALAAIPACRHAFIRRIPGIEVSYEKAEVLARLDAAHREIRRSLAMDRGSFLTAQQVHRDRIAVIDRPAASDECFSECDGLITNQPEVCLGIYVADCCAIFLVDPIRGCVGLVHSGKKGTELGIVSRAIAQMRESFGSVPADLVVQLSPCIRPPHYEINFAAEIARQCREAGVTAVHDCNICTACDLDRYYSYRAKKGRTGRMLALLDLASSRAQSRDPLVHP
ncbi:MAG: polyphenol oxidase family protein [Verrucomicrobiota bacterium]